METPTLNRTRNQCQHIFKKGEREGQQCPVKTSYEYNGGYFCQTHIKEREKKKVRITTPPPSPETTTNPIISPLTEPVKQEDPLVIKEPVKTEPIVKEPVKQEQEEEVETLMLPKYEEEGDDEPPDVPE